MYAKYWVTPKVLIRNIVMKIKAPGLLNLLNELKKSDIVFFATSFKNPVMLNSILSRDMKTTLKSHFCVKSVGFCHIGYMLLLESFHNATKVCKLLTRL